MHRNQPREVKEKEETEKLSPKKEQEKTPEINLNEMEISDLLDKEFKIMGSKNNHKDGLLRSEEQCIHKVRISTKR